MMERSFFYTGLGLLIEIQMTASRKTKAKFCEMLQNLQTKECFCKEIIKLQEDIRLISDQVANNLTLSFHEPPTYQVTARQSSFFPLLNYLTMALPMMVNRFIRLQRPPERK